jgi:hypothetical protein
VFSTQAAYAAPLILLSQNRQADTDRITAEHDYRVNQLALQHLIAWHRDAQPGLPVSARSGRSPMTCSPSCPRPVTLPSRRSPPGARCSLHSRTLSAATDA